MYALFRRNEPSGGYWQFIAGGGDSGETPLEAARREAQEEAGIEASSRFISLDARIMIPVVNVSGFLWGKDTLVIPEYCFGVEVYTDTFVLSEEHSAYAWMKYSNAHELLKWDSNRIALWELNYRLSTPA